MSRTLVVACLVLLSAVAAAPTAAGPLTSKSAVYEDERGELALGPDITSVQVSSDDAALRFKLSIPSHAVLTDDMRLRIWLDADDDRSTGLAVEDRRGFDHFLLVERWELGPGAVGLYSCTGSSCSGRRSTSIAFSYASGATFVLDPTELGVGRLTRFRFAAEAAAGIGFDEATRRYDFSNWRQDAAPESGRFWTYDMRTAVVERFSATPAAAAGKPLTLRLRAVDPDTGATLRAGTVTCSCRIAGRPLRPRSSRFTAGTAVCGFDIPRSARGKRFRSSISVSFPGAEVARSVSGRIR